MHLPSWLQRFADRLTGRSTRRPLRTKAPVRLRLERLEERDVPTTIQGAVYLDLNGGGTRDAGEPGLAGQTLFLDPNRNGILDAGETTALTNAAGEYTFDTTNEPPAPGLVNGAIRDYLSLVLETGSGGRWLDTTATYAVVDRIVSPDATRDFGVRFQPFVGVAPVGPETRVNASVDGQQGGLARMDGEPLAIAADAAGNYVVAWRTFVTGGTDTIHARVFNADGTPRTGDLLVGTGEAFNGPQYAAMPSVAMSGDGRFAVAWSHHEFTAGSEAVHSTLVRAYQSSGAPVTSAVTIVKGTTKTSARVEGVAMDGDGDFAVLYGQKTFSNGSGWSTYTAYNMQRYTKAGATNGKAITVVSSYLVSGERSLAMDAAGNAVVVWDDVLPQGPSTTRVVSAQRFDAAGRKIGSLITVAAVTAPQSDLVWQSSVAMTADGRFVVAWEYRVSASTPDDHIYYAQLFGADGARVGTAREVGRNRGTSEPMGMAYDQAGNVTFTYSHIRGTIAYDRGEVRYRRLTAAGELEPESIVNTTTQSAQFRPGIAATGNGTFVIAWQGYGPGDDAGIFAQHYAPVAPYTPVAPQVGSFTANPNPVTAGDPLTLLASDILDVNPGAIIVQVAFYRDANGDGILQAGTDLLIGYGVHDADAWILTFTTENLSAGSYTFFALALDSYGLFSDPLATSSEVV